MTTYAHYYYLHLDGIPLRYGLSVLHVPHPHTCTCTFCRSSTSSFVQTREERSAVDIYFLRYVVRLFLFPLWLFVYICSPFCLVVVPFLFPWTGPAAVFAAMELTLFFAFFVACIFTYMKLL
jgi:hypothetical protein